VSIGYWLLLLAIGCCLLAIGYCLGIGYYWTVAVVCCLLAIGERLEVSCGHTARVSAVHRIRLRVVVLIPEAEARGSGGVH
jgi:hypothetical protein